MAFQSSVATQIGAGVVGELAYEGPLRAQPGILDTTDPTNNVIGRALSVKAGATGSWAAGSAGAADPKPIAMEAGGDGPFAGILANPKVYPLLGTSVGGPLASSMTLPNDTVVEAITEGDVWVELNAAANPGDPVYYLQASGILTRTAPGAARPDSSVGPIGSVVRFVSTVANLAVIHLESTSERAANA